MRIRLATRNSPLALIQARIVAALLEEHVDSLELLPVRSLGDADQATALANFGSTGIFTKALEMALIDGRAEVAVHSAKDLPTTLDPRFVLAAFPCRADARDALVGARLEDLPTCATVATGSPRRRAQLAAYRPDILFSGLRGNIETRLRACESVNAVVMGAAALDRLQMGSDVVIDRLDTSLMLPAQGQGAIAVEVLADSEVESVVRQIDDPEVRFAVLAERALINAIGGGCSAPVAAYCVPDCDGQMRLTGAVYSLNGHRAIRCERVVEDPVIDGIALGRELLNSGADEILFLSKGIESA